MRFTLLAVLISNAFLASSSTPHIFEQATPITQSSAQIQQHLGSKLSSQAGIYFPGNSNYTVATSRWSPYEQPNISVVVEVGNANDVVETIRYANSVGMPFLAVNRGHGSPVTLAKVHHGIEIWLSKLDDIEIAEDGKTALLGGGVYIKKVIDALALKKKVTGE
jgi:FAD/FMN-containing dehydrogenase